MAQVDDTPYRIGETIGRGAVAEVVRLHPAAGGAARAGKILHASLAADADAVARFVGEARLMQTLRHPNLVAAHGLCWTEGRPMLVMELVDGPSLDRLIARRAPLPETRLRAIAAGIAAGLGAAHEAGVIHRDLKPSNVLVGPGEQPKLGDLGMARASSFAGIDREALGLVGTPDYMAPESVDPLAVDARSDLYALGCILFEMATGRPPFGGATPFSVLDAHRTAPVPELPDDYSGQLRGLVRSLLAKSPADRPQSARAVADALQPAQLDGAPVVGSPAALARTETAGGSCASCGDPLTPHVPICIACGMARPLLQPGDHAVFVTGPGDTSDKLSTELRQRLLQWCRANPQLGLDAEPLARRIPRLPFVVCERLAERAAERLAQSLRALGLTAEIIEGGRFALPALRKKLRSMTLRGLGVTASFYSIGNFIGGGWILAVMPAMVATGALIGLTAAGLRRAVRQRQRPSEALPSQLQTRLDRLATVAAQIRAARHRHGLRAVVQRALALRDELGSTRTPEIDEELGQAIDLAVVAAARMDEIDRQLAQGDLRQLDTDARALLHQRDRWSARSLDLAALLEVSRARLATAGTLGAHAESRELLDELRARIESLEEVQTG